MKKESLHPMMKSIRADPPALIHLRHRVAFRNSEMDRRWWRLNRHHWVHRNFKNSDLVSPAAVKNSFVLESKLMPCPVDDVVIRQVVHRNDAAVTRREVSKLSCELNAAIGQQSRRYRCVVIGRDIPVPWDADFGTAST